MPLYSGPFNDDIFNFAVSRDLSDAAAYEEVCRHLDTDDLIDWFILEGYSGNWDVLFGNLSFYRSSENDGRWRTVFYDLDESFAKEASYIYGNVLVYDRELNYGGQLVKSLLQNEDFRERMLRRFVQAMDTTLSNENVLAEIDRLYAMLEPEIERDRARYGITLEEYRARQDELRRLIAERDMAQICFDFMSEYFELDESDWQRLQEEQ